MSDKRVKNFRIWALVFGAAILCAYIYIVWQYTSLLVNEREKYISVIDRNEISTVELRGHRGNIYDCRGRLVSASLPEYILYMDLTIPYIHEGKGKKLFPERLDSLCLLLSTRFGEETPEHLKSRLMAAYRRNDPKKHDNYVRLLKRKLSYEEYQEVLQMPLMRSKPSVGGRVEDERHHRENLFGDMAQRIIGAVHGLDDTTRTLGYYGLEQYFDKQLSGTKGIYMRQLVGKRLISIPIVPAEDGCDIVMTLDMDMQDVCECTLRNTLIESGAESACMILMEVETGDIKSVVNLTLDSAGRVCQGTNMAFAMNNQPGSTFKTVCLMAALETGKCDTSTMVLVNGGKGTFGGSPVSDSHTYPEMYLSLPAILARSSNVGMAQLMEDVYGKRRENWRTFSEDVEKIGFDRHIPIEIRGCADPIIHRYEDYKDIWDPTTMTAMSRGYAVQTTPLYTLNFYNAIANDGYYVKPRLVTALRRGSEIVEEYDVVTSRSRMCSRSTIRDIQYMLQGVVSRPDGTAHRYASSELFSVAGKTGTTQYRQLRDGSWQYQISFVGYFPADKPKYSAIVVFMCPKRAYTGMYCGGVFKQVAETVWSMDQAR